MNFHIRRGTKKDLSRIIEVIKNSFHSRYPAAGEFYSVQQLVDSNYATSAGPYYSSKFFIKSIIRDLESKFRRPFEIFVAELTKEIIGFIILENNEGNFWINNVMIKKGYQGKNIGKELFNFVAKNKKPLYLWVNAKNPAVKFWKTLGFKEILREVLMIKK